MAASRCSRFIIRLINLPYLDRSPCYFAFRGKRFRVADVIARLEEIGERPAVQKAMAIGPEFREVPCYRSIFF